MIISAETQQEMYIYLAKQSLKNMYDVDSNLSEIINYQIKILAQKLFNRSELFVKKALWIYDEAEDKIKTTKEAAKDTAKDDTKDGITDGIISKSNILIYDALDCIKGCKRFLINTNKVEIKNIDYSTVIETGSPDRVKLIKLCKKFMQRKDLSTKKNNTADTYEARIAELGTLADQTIGVYTEEIQKKYPKIKEVFVQKHLKSKHEFMQDLVPDIVIVTANKVYVIDVKVRKNIANENMYHPFAYAENSNRFQLNSYIGAYKSIYPDKEIEGILLHFANQELFDKNEMMHGKLASIESDRPIRVYLLEDRGLDNIFKDYRKIIEEIISVE